MICLIYMKALVTTEHVDLLLNIVITKPAFTTLDIMNRKFDKQRYLCALMKTFFHLTFSAE